MSRIHEALRRAAEERRHGALPPEAGGLSAVAAPEEGAAAGARAQQEVEAPAGTETEEGGSLLPDSPLPLLPPLLPLGELQSWRSEVQARVVASLDPKSLAAEQYRTLRARIRRSLAGTRRFVILVSSPGMGEGKTLTSLNLAFSLAQEVEHRVLLIDGDLRKPKVAEYCGIPGRQHAGLRELLDGQVTLERALWRDSRSGLHVLGSGEPPDNPSELLGSPAMRRQLDRLRSHFDEVLIDAPPVNPVADPTILLPLVDGLVMVVRYGQTGGAALRKALESLPEGKLLGLVFNSADLGSVRHYYHYRY